MSVKSLFFAIFLILCSIFLSQVKGSKAFLKASSLLKQTLIDYVYCDDTRFRNKLTCIGQLNNVCAFKINCETGNCYETMLMDCLACHAKIPSTNTPIYDGYINGSCESHGLLPEKVPADGQYCGTKYTRRYEAVKCANILEEVCGFHYSDFKCPSPPCVTTYQNICQACSAVDESNMTRASYYFKKGNCAEIRASIRQECKKDDIPKPSPGPATSP